MKYSGYLVKIWPCKRRSVKGFVLSKIMIEFVVATILIMVVCQLTVYFTQYSVQEEIKQESVMLNISAVEIMKQMLYSGTAVADILQYTNTKEGYVTKVSAVDEVQGGGEWETISDVFTLYRVVVTTTYKGQAIWGTELVTYILAKKS